MKKILIILFFFTLSKTSIAQINNKIFLKVENEIITNYEIKNKILSSLIISKEEINQKNINKYKKVITNLLIENKLKKIEVNKYNIKEDKAKINNYLNSITSSIPDLKNTFLANGLDFQLYVDEISIELKWRELIYKIYSKKIEIDESNLEKEIEEFVQNKSFIEEYKISEIEVVLNQNEDIEKKIFTIKSQIKEEGFEVAALKYNSSYSASKKGSLGWISSKSLSKDILEVLKKLKINEVSAPIKKLSSIIFLKLDDKRISKTDDLNIVKIKQNLIDKKKNEQFDLYSNSHLSKLRNTSTIEFK